MPRGPGWTGFWAARSAPRTSSTRGSELTRRSTDNASLAARSRPGISASLTRTVNRWSWCVTRVRSPWRVNATFHTNSCSSRCRSGLPITVVSFTTFTVRT